MDNELGDFELFVKIVIRHEVVSAVNLVGKNLIQSEGMLTDVQTIVFYAL